MITKNSEKREINVHKFHCDKCDYSCVRKHDYIKHLQTKKHNDTIDDYKKSENVHFCECGKSYSHRQNLYRHKRSCILKNNSDDDVRYPKWIKFYPKWIMSKKMSIFEKSGILSEKKSKIFNCLCGKTYKYSSGLSKHKLKCSYNKQNAYEINENDLEKKIISILNNKIPENNENLKHELKETIVEAMKQNSSDIKDIMEEVKEIAKQPKTVNNQINILNYLNTECKDAINFSDFINNFLFSLNDLNILSTQGYLKSIEYTLYKELNNMEKHMRPLHCSDKKRKKFYVKDKDIWEKDDDNYIIKQNMYKFKNIHSKTLQEWKRENYDWLDDEDKQEFLNQTIISATDIFDDKIFNKVLNKFSQLSLK